MEIAIEFNWSPVVKSLQSGVRAAEIADHPRVGVLFDTAHYHVTPTKLSDINGDSVKCIKHVHLDDMPDTPADLAHRDFDRVLPGEGVLDLPGIIWAVESNGYGGYSSVELFNAELVVATAGLRRRRVVATRACCRCAKDEEPRGTRLSRYGRFLVRIAVLGAGRIGSFWARVLSGLPEVDEVIVGNRTVGRAEALAREVGGTAGTIEGAVESGPDAVCVSLATGLHAGALHRCLDAGLPIFCEKPIALTLSDTAEVIEHAERAGNLLQIAFQRRLDPDYLRAYREIRAGSLGKLYSVRITAHDAEPAPEEFIASSGGTYRDLHIHDFDLARWLTGMEIEQVYTVGSVRGFDRYAKYGDVDNVAILMTMSDGLPVLITGTRHNPRGHDFRMEVFGSEDSLSVGSDSLSQPRPVEPDAVLLSKGPYRDFIERFGEGLRQETIAFIEVMRGERENPSPPASAMEALRAAVACEVSREEGRPVRLSEIADDSTGPS